MQVTVDVSKKFPNGTFVFHEDGSQVDPKSSEGTLIQSIWDHQKVVREQNTQQKISWAWTTYPRDDVARQNWLKSQGLDPNSPAPRQ